jgi:hypothetical protein
MSRAPRQPLPGIRHQYLFFHDTRHPKDMGAADIEAFLTHLAVQQTVAASTQHQALSA